MDRKPESLMDDEYRQLEAIVAALLKEAGADDLVHIFAKNRITIETMMTLKDDDLEALGVEDPDKRKAVLKQIEVNCYYCRSCSCPHSRHLLVLL